MNEEKGVSFFKKLPRLQAEGAMVDASFWRNLRAEFEALKNEESPPPQGPPKGEWLVAYVEYRGAAKCACGHWMVYGGLNEDFRARFDVLATRAGAALGPPRRTKALDFWLHRLYLDLLEHRSSLLFHARQKGENGIIERVCAASVIYCARLEKQAVEKSAHEREVLPAESKVRLKRRSRFRKPLLPAEKRARTVAKIIRELDVLKPQMYGDSAYDQLEKKHSDFLTFKVAAKHAELKLKVFNVQEHRRHYRLAQELVAAYYGKHLSTVQTDWKRHKPKKFRRTSS